MSLYFRCIAIVFIELCVLTSYGESPKMVADSISDSAMFSNSGTPTFALSAPATPVPGGGDVQGGAATLSAPGFPTISASLTAVPTSGTITFGDSRPPRTSDRSFFSLAALSLAANVADAESTLRALHHGGREANPLLGPRPSRARVYGTFTPVWAGGVLLSRTLRMRVPQSKTWMFPFLAMTAAHGAAAVWNLHF
jgi:hypothetical protein